MKKRMILFFVAGSLCIHLLIGCSTDVVSDENMAGVSSVKAASDEAIPFQLELVYEDEYDFSYYRDPITDVLYLWKVGDHKGGLTEMSDPETGLPLTYTRYMELYQALAN